MYGSQWGSLVAARSLYKAVFVYCKSRENKYQYYKSRVCIWTGNEMKGSYDEIIITIVPTYTRRKYHLFLSVGIVTRAPYS